MPLQLQLRMSRFSAGLVRAPMESRRNICIARSILTSNFSLMSSNSSVRSVKVSSITLCGVLRPFVCTLINIRYSRGCGILYPANVTSLSSNNCLWHPLHSSAPAVASTIIRQSEQECIETCPACTHMRIRFPTVWSSRCSSNVPALVTFVSFV